MIESTAGGVVLTVRVIPRAGRSGVAGTRDGALLIRLNAPPVDGAANAELIDVVAETLGVAPRAVTIMAGERSRTKRVRITGIDATHAASRLPH
ncbi:MAG TPA: DUF167 domain-containing protein [Vicinamibacterales bacterium]